MLGAGLSVRAAATQREAAQPAPQPARHQLTLSTYPFCRVDQGGPTRAPAVAVSCSLPSHSGMLWPCPMVVRDLKPRGLMRSAASDWAIIGMCLGRRSSVGMCVWSSTHCI
jgi:hypothetical protein